MKSYYRSEKGLLRFRYNKQVAKSKSRGHKAPNYSFEEFKDWAYSKGYKNIYDEWVLNSYNTKFSPSIDRINPNIGYTFENIRLTTWELNSKYNHYNRKRRTLNKKLMSVKLNKLWGTSRFTKLTTNSKFLYLYLTTHNNLTVVGVLNIPMSLMVLETGLELEDIRASTKELIDSKYIHVEGISGNVYFIVPEHFNTIPKSDSSIMKIQKELVSLPEGLVKLLRSLNIGTDRKVVKFIEPTTEEIMEYALSRGHKIDAKVFVEYYRGKGKEFGKDGQWLNFKGKPVRDWKATLRNVWFKDENKIKTVDGAPKGFESFYIDFEGKQVFPESWRGGKPHSKNMIVNKALQREYEKRRTGS